LSEKINITNKKKKDFIEIYFERWFYKIANISSEPSDDLSPVYQPQFDVYARVCKKLIKFLVPCPPNLTRSSISIC
jgi:hypothetical protein